MHHKRSLIKALARTDPLWTQLPYEIRYLQEPQLPQRGRATLRVVENLAKLVKFIRNYITEYGVCNYGRT